MTATASTAADDPIARTIDEVARVAERSQSYILQRIADGTLPHVRIGHRLLVLEADTSVLLGSPAAGLAALATAWRGRKRVRLTEAAAALGVSVRSLKRLALRGKLPAHRDAGPWTIARDELVRWLFRHRVPCRWEIAA